MQYLGAAGGHQDHQDDGPGAVEVKQATSTAEVPSSDEVDVSKENGHRVP